ncbi:type IV toxin-antitoxin system AbiEi family antitoxin domain-containing protein [Polaromonas sp. LjRoot131]|uniref:type IV toxin-antitoxin system AbiEi family antitoxin domain-containing protein n=1 Tax=Polaromonas sp. LjRoot131 TaxID=3342262 RepID=UPI003ECCF076
MARSRIQIAKADIVSHFDQLPNPVLKLKEVRDILTTQRSFWRLAANTTAAQFISFLKDHSKLKIYEFPFPQRSETAYVWGDVPLLQVLLNIKKNVHFSHYTAVRMLGLTEQVPNSIYLTNERATWPTDPPELTQSEIDDSFKRPERLTANWIEQGDKKIFLLNGAGTGHLGVVVQPANDDDGRVVQARLTNMERTLIDITVRPAYAGGVFEVAKAFELAKDRVSVNKLVPMLRKLDFAYPYHQAIGYYLERAGYKPAQLDLIRRLPMVHDFYLAHDMPDTRYEQAWRLFVPKGF